MAGKIIQINKEINKEVNFETILEGISDERARHGFRLVLNLVEELAADNRSLREEVQRLRDENNRLKGEQGKPQIKPRKPITSESREHSSQRERHKPKDHNKGSKTNRVTIDEEKRLKVDPATLPADALSKGHEEVIIQDLIVKTHNTLFFKEKWYCPSTGKTYLAQLPPGYTGAYGPGIKSLTVSLYYGSNMSQPKILEFVQNAGIIISSGTLSNILTDNSTATDNRTNQDVLNQDVLNQDRLSFHQVFEQEQEQIYRCGLLSSIWQGVDHTPTSINGKLHECQVVGNSFYSIYATVEKRNRQSIIDVLRNQHHQGINHQGKRSPGSNRTYLLNEQAHEYLEPFRFSGVIRRTLKAMPQDEVLPEGVFVPLIRKRLPQLNQQQFDQILDAGAIAAYNTQQDWPVVRLLLCDDAPAFKGITCLLQLCWVHEGRHYKKLTPLLSGHRLLLEEFRKEFWKFYHKLLEYQQSAYQQHPTLNRRMELSRDFDTLFSTNTGYDELDKRIEKTKAKKETLLTVLEHPEVPLHNNGSELAARGRVRKRDVSFGPRSKEGSRAWDVYMSIAATARKLGVSFYHYLYDRISKDYKMPSLASLIEQRSSICLGDLHAAAA